MAERRSPVDVPADAPVHWEGLPLDYRPTALRIGENPYALQVDCIRWRLLLEHGTLSADQARVLAADHPRNDRPIKPLREAPLPLGWATRSGTGLPGTDVLAR